MSAIKTEFNLPTCSEVYIETEIVYTNKIRPTKTNNPTRTDLELALTVLSAVLSNADNLLSSSP